MAKRSQKRSIRYEKDQTGCISGFMSIFDFRHGRSSRKLLADKKRENRHTNASTSVGSSSNNIPAVTKSDFISEAEKSVKKLMEEEMIYEEIPEKQINISKEGPEELNSRKHHRRKSRASKKSIDMDINEQNVDLETIIEELRQIHDKSNVTYKNDINVPLDEAEEKLNEAIKVFMSHKLTNNHSVTREDGSNNYQSREFIDALQTISLYNELFLKHLQDPNSMLVKLIKDFEGASTQLNEPKPRKFFRRRSKSQDSYNSLEGDGSSSKIVILKPGLSSNDNDITSLNSRYSLENKNGSNFSFSEFKRRLKHAMGKEHENQGWRSPNRNHFLTERFAKPLVDKLKDVEIDVMNKKGESNIYIEAKKHLSDMLNNGEEDDELINKKSPKSLGKILSLPDYKESFIYSPEKDTQDSFLNATTILSEQNLQENELHVHNEDYDKTRDIVSENLVKEFAGMSPQGILEIDEPIKTQDHTEDEITDIFEISITNSPSSKDIEEEKTTQSLNLESNEQDRENSKNKTKVEDSDEAITKTDRPSPVSVLEPLFSEDDISPNSTTDRQVEIGINPRKIDFEDESFFMEEGESPFEYVEAVLLGSGLNWDDFLLRWLISDQILDPSLFDEVELFSSRGHDQKLLFDCTNEVLKEVCDSYFGGFMGISFVKQSIKSPPKGMNLINEIWEGVELRLFQHLPPKSLDQLVKKDLTNSKMWMNPHLDSLYVRIVMEDAIFQELIEDTISSFLASTHNISNGSHEIEISVD